MSLRMSMLSVMASVNHFSNLSYRFRRCCLTAASVTTAFNESRGKTVSFVQNTKEDLRGHASPHPILKALDGYQWELLLSAHSARHTAQIQEVKSDPNFPKQ